MRRIRISLAPPLDHYIHLQERCCSQFELELFLMGGDCACMRNRTGGCFHHVKSVSKRHPHDIVENTHVLNYAKKWRSLPPNFCQHCSPCQMPRCLSRRRVVCVSSVGKIFPSSAASFAQTRYWLSGRRGGSGERQTSGCRDCWAGIPSRFPLGGRKRRKSYQMDSNH